MLYIRDVKIVVAFLLLLLTASGTFYPCCMEDDCADELVASSTEGDQQHEETTCSPFFACGTCPGAVDLPKVETITIPSTGEKLEHQGVYLVRLASFSPSFFQPPRLAPLSA